MKQPVAWEFSLFKMRRSMESYADEHAIRESERLWKIYDGLPVIFDIDSNNGHIKDTEIIVNKKWCERSVT